MGIWIRVFSLLITVVVPTGVLAHGGHLHKVMGTVVGVQGSQVEVKATDGKNVSVRLDAKTAITRGKAKLDVTALKAGDRVSIDYMQEKNVNLAKTVKLGTAPTSK